MMRWWPVRAGALGAVAVAGAVVLGACGGAKYEYVSNSSEQLYFKVPRGWELYRFTDSDTEGRLVGLPESFEQVWRVGFDAADEPDPSNVAQLDAVPPDTLEQPVGQARVFAVNSAAARDGLSLAAARELALGFDPLNAPDDLSNLVEVVDFLSLDERNGVQGSRVVFNVRNSVDDPWQTMDVTTMYDVTKARLYMFTVACSASCFEQNQNSIFDVTTSWKVEP
jgi:hypothetical protein